MTSHGKRNFAQNLKTSVNISLFGLPISVIFATFFEHFPNKWPQGSRATPKSDQKTPKWTPRVPKWSPRVPQWSPKVTPNPQKAAQICPKGDKMDPRVPQWSPKVTPSAKKTPQGPPKCHYDIKIWPEVPKKRYTDKSTYILQDPWYFFQGSAAVLRTSIKPPSVNN